MISISFDGTDTVIVRRHRCNRCMAPVYRSTARVSLPWDVTVIVRCFRCCSTAPLSIHGTDIVRRSRFDGTVTVSSNGTDIVIVRRYCHRSTMPCYSRSMASLSYQHDGYRYCLMTPIFNDQQHRHCYRQTEQLPLSFDGTVTGLVRRH